MNEILKNELRENEKILWLGKAEKFDVLDKTHKKPMLVKATVVLTITILFAALYLLYAQGHGIKVKPATIALVLVFAAAISFGYIIDAIKLRGVVYAITDQRLIAIQPTANSVEFNTINKLILDTDADGHTSLLCGKMAIKAKAYKRRNLSLCGPYIDPDTGICDRFIMYNIAEPEKVEELLRDFLPL